jgi:hypothetical protein
VEFDLAIGRWEWGEDASAAASPVDQSAFQAERDTLETSHLPRLRVALAEVTKVSVGDIKLSVKDNCCALTTIELPGTLVALNEGGVTYTGPTRPSGMASAVSANYVPKMTFDSHTTGAEVKIKLQVRSLLPSEASADPKDFATAVWAVAQNGDMVVWERLNAPSADQPASAATAAASPTFDGDVRMSTVTLKIPLGVTHLTPYVYWELHGVWTGTTQAVPADVASRPFTSSSIIISAAAARAKATAAAEAKVVAAMHSWDVANAGRLISDESRADLAEEMVAAGGTWVLVHGQVEAGSREQADSLASRLGAWSAQRSIAGALGITAGDSPVLMLQSPVVVETPAAAQWYDALAPWQWGAVGLGALVLLGGCHFGRQRQLGDHDDNLGLCSCFSSFCGHATSNRQFLHEGSSGRGWGDVKHTEGAAAPSPRGELTVHQSSDVPFSAPNPIYSRTGGGATARGESDENRVRM